MCCGQLESHPRFRREAKNPMVFHVNHYAGPVNYDTSSFLDKNRDVLQADLIQVPPPTTPAWTLSSCSVRAPHSNASWVQVDEVGLLAFGVSFFTLRWRSAMTRLACRRGGAAASGVLQAGPHAQLRRFVE